jgi:hypothetical protein
MPDLYGDMLNRSMSNYGNVLKAFSSGQANLSSSLPGIYAGYDQLDHRVGDLLGQSYALGAGDIQKQAAVNSANVTQGLANRGLSNSTIWGNLQNQQSQQTQREYAGLALGVANQALDRQTQIRMARQAAQMQGLGLQTNLYGQQGSTLAGYHFPAPPAGYGGGGGGGGYGGGGYGGSGRVSGGGYAQTNWGRDPNYSQNSYTGGAGAMYLGGAMGYGTPASGGGGVNYGEEFSPIAQQQLYDQGALGADEGVSMGDLNQMLWEESGSYF